MVRHWKKLLVGALGALSFSSAQAAPACVGCSDWVISPDGNTTAGSVTVVNGVAQFNGPDTTQPVGIFGAGFTKTGTSLEVEFDADLNTWDSYNAFVGGATGYFDAFIVTISTSGFYWSLPHTDPILADASTFVWGGTNYGDGILESYITAPGNTDMVALSSESPTTFYVSLVLDTKTTPFSDTLHPSYGSFHVNVIPEPETYAMLLAGLGLMGFLARRRQRNLAAA
jgi:hypothetical protein